MLLCRWLSSDLIVQTSPVSLKIHLQRFSGYLPCCSANGFYAGDDWRRRTNSAGKVVGMRMTNSSDARLYSPFTSPRYHLTVMRWADSICSYFDNAALISRICLGHFYAFKAVCYKSHLFNFCGTSLPYFECNVRLRSRCSWVSKSHACSVTVAVLVPEFDDEFESLSSLQRLLDAFVELNLRTLLRFKVINRDSKGCVTIENLFGERSLLNSRFLSIVFACCTHFFLSINCRSSW